MYKRQALGYSIGTSICESDKVELAKDTMAKAKEKGVKFLIPVDNIVGLEYKPDTEHKLVDSDRIPDGWMGLDIGPKTVSYTHLTEFERFRLRASGLFSIGIRTQDSGCCKRSSSGRPAVSLPKTR